MVTAEAAACGSEPSQQTGGVSGETNSGGPSVPADAQTAAQVPTLEQQKRTFQVGEVARKQRHLEKQLAPAKKRFEAASAAQAKLENAPVRFEERAGGIYRIERVGSSAPVATRVPNDPAQIAQARNWLEHQGTCSRRSRRRRRRTA